MTANSVERDLHNCNYNKFAAGFMLIFAYKNWMYLSEVVCLLHYGYLLTIAIVQTMYNWFSGSNIVGERLVVS